MAEQREVLILANDEVPGFDKVHVCVYADMWTMGANVLMCGIKDENLAGTDGVQFPWDYWHGE